MFCHSDARGPSSVSAAFRSNATQAAAGLIFSELPASVAPSEEAAGSVIIRMIPRSGPRGFETLLIAARVEWQRRARSVEHPLADATQSLDLGKSASR
jgi:hypothetical protein